MRLNMREKANNGALATSTIQTRMRFLGTTIGRIFFSIV
jgi:hypothetical protein